jgi:hypothetical protein
MAIMQVCIVFDYCSTITTRVLVWLKYKNLYPLRGLHLEIKTYVHYIISYGLQQEPPLFRLMFKFDVYWKYTEVPWKEKNIDMDEKYIDQYVIDMVINTE